MFIYQTLVLIALLLFFGMVFRNLKDYASLPPDIVPPRPEESLIVLIPARNESANIAECLTGLLNQTLANYDVIVLDDSSDDGTDRIVEEIASQGARVSLMRGNPIKPGWAGKVWACSQLGEEALKREAKWLLFLDADTRAKPGLLQTLLAHAQETDADMVSSFPYQVTGTFWERVVLPNLHFLILTFLPIRMIWESPIPSIAAACGQVELFSSEAYRKSGGHAGIPASFHDGLQLSRKVKATGGIVRLFDGSALISCRMYDGGRAVWQGFTRNAYEGLGSLGALIVMSSLQFFFFFLPYCFATFWLVAGLITRQWPQWGLLCLMQVGLISAQRLAQAKRFGHPECALLHPLSMLALISIEWASFFKSKRKSRVTWKGRSY